MKFKKLFDSQDRRRRMLAKRALEETRRLDAARYPLAMLFDKLNGPSVERQTGESWPQAFARSLGGLTLEQLRDYTAGLLETGYYRTSESDEKAPTAKDLVNYFLGASALLVETERELANAGPR